MFLLTSTNAVNEQPITYVYAYVFNIYINYFISKRILGIYSRSRFGIRLKLIGLDERIKSLEAKINKNAYWRL